MIGNLFGIVRALALRDFRILCEVICCREEAESGVLIDNRFLKVIARVVEGTEVREFLHNYA